MAGSESGQDKTRIICSWPSVPDHVVVQNIHMRPFLDQLKRKEEEFSKTLIRMFPRFDQDHVD